MIKRCILIAAGLEMLLVSVGLSYAVSFPHGDTDGNERAMPFPWDVFIKNILIVSPVIAIAVGLIVYNFRSLKIENAVEKMGRRVRLWIIQIGLIIILFLLPWRIIGIVQKWK